jgi:hypothetical protein
MRDAEIVATLVVGFAGLVTAHLASIVGLAARSPRHRALVALVVPVLAPYWAAKARMVVRTVLWVASFAVYALALVAAAR